MQHSWAYVSDDPSVAAHAAALATSSACTKDAARVLAMLRDVLEHDPPPDTALAAVQAALALAYTSFLRTPTANADAAAILGIAAEALVAVHTDTAFALACKLLTYAHLHVGAVDHVHFRRMAQRLGQAGEPERVLQVLHIAAQHHAAAHDEALHHARLLALDALGRDADYDAAAQAQSQVPAYTHELHAYHAAVRRDASQLVRALQALPETYPLACTTYLSLAYAYPPLRPLLAQLPSDAQSSPRALFDALVRRAHDTHSDHIPSLLALFGVVPPGTPAHGAPVHLPPNVCAALAARAVPASAATLARAATWCGHRAMPAWALALFSAALRAAPDATPRAVVEERQPVAGRSADHAALQHAAAGVVRACVAAGTPQAGAAFAARVVGTPLPTEAAADASDLTASIAALPAAAVERGSIITAALLACAGALQDAAYARAVLEDAAHVRLKPNGRIRRALARMLLASVAGHYGEMQQLVRQLTHRTPWMGGPAPTPTDPGAARLAKLREALATLGFEDEAQLALLQGVRQQSAAGARPAHGESRDASYVWVRDTPLQPAAHEPWASAHAPRDTEHATSGERGALASAARLRLCAAQGDADGAQAAFRALLDADVRPRAMHLVPLVQSLCRAQRTAEAQWVLRVALRAWDVAPTHAMYAALLTALADAGDWRGVHREEHEMVRAGLAPDAAVCDSLALARTRQLGTPDAPAEHVVDAALAQNASAVTRHFQRRMQARDYVGAQQFYAECLEHGLRPHYAHRRMLKRAGNYVQKQLRRAPDAAELHEALRLQERNAARSAFATHPAGRAHVVAERRYRRALVHLVRDVVAGRIERAVRTDTRPAEAAPPPAAPSTAAPSRVAQPATGYEARYVAAT